MVETLWNALPLEIHDAILSQFCRDLIAEYKRKYKLFNAKKASRNSRRLLTWPAPPQPLVDFASALRTSRSFYHSLHRFKINGKTPTLEFQFLQKDICRGIRKKATKAVNKLDCCRIDVGVFMEIAGVFWKNPLILDMQSRTI